MNDLMWLVFLLDINLSSKGHLPFRTIICCSNIFVSNWKHQCEKPSSWSCISIYVDKCSFFYTDCLQRSTVIYNGLSVPNYSSSKLIMYRKQDMKDTRVESVVKGYWSVKLWFCSGSSTSSKAAAGSPCKLLCCNVVCKYRLDENIQ